MNTHHPSSFVAGLGLAVVLALATPRAPAQPTVVLADLPFSTPGTWSKYLTTTSSIASAALLGQPGGPQRWDFSGPRTAAEAERRVDIVAVADSGRGSRFPEARHAERITHGPSGGKSWSYYRFDPAQGRSYYGFDDPVGDPLDPLVVFDQPTIDLPPVLRYGDTWQRSVSFPDRLDSIVGTLDLRVTFSSTANVDAWGTVVLPGIGEVEAVRVHELNVYDLVELGFGLPLGKQYVRNVAWYSPRLGEVARVISEVATSGPPPASFPVAKTFQRLTDSSSAPREPALVYVSRLAASRQGARLFLSWAAAPEAKGYVIEAASRIADPSAWSRLATNLDNFVFLDLPNDLRATFYRVHVQP